MEASTAGVDTLRGNEKKGIIIMAIPMAVALFMQMLNNIVDSFWVSDLGGNALAALGIIYPIYCVQIGIGNGLGVGVSAAIARSIGEGDREKANRIAGQSLLLTIIVAAVITAILMLTARASIPIIGGGGMVDLCLEYAYPLYISTFFILLSGVMSGMLRGEGAARASMIIQVTGALVNIVLDPIFIFGLDMGVSGAAWATVVAFIVPCIIAMYWYLSGTGMYVRSGMKYLSYDRSSQKEILSVGLPEAVELSVMNFFNIFLNYYVIFVGGTDALAIYSTSWRVVYMLIIPAQAVGGAMVAMCSAELGMGRFDMIRRAFAYSIKISVVSLIALSILLAILSDPIAALFTHSPDMNYMHMPMRNLLLMFAVFLPAFSLVFTGSSLMQALNKADKAMVNTFARNCIVVAAMAVPAYTIGTMDSIWWGLAISEIFGGFMMLVHACITLRSVSDEYARRTC